ncbi:MAG: arabinogalactan endo-beta-1,4-galactanase [Muribaculaceae bacterium]
MNILKNIFSATIIVAIIALGACKQDSPITIGGETPETLPIDRTAFAKGADVSWLSELEAEGYTFTDADGVQKECMQLLKEDCGVNAIRLRVWVNPTEGWNNIDDVVYKARRANALGLRLMIDFHFSDTWADPGNQITPAAWADYDLTQLKEAVANHVNEMLSKLKKLNIEPEWVQIGNETRGGMLYPIGEYTNGQNYADLVNTAYDAIKAVFPEALAIIHLDSGNRLDLYTRIFGTLKNCGGKYDMIGMSLYPEPDNWESIVESCIATIKTVSTTYGKPVMICEVGMDYNYAETCKSFISSLMAKGIATGNLKGIFYWEPEAPAGYNGGYNKGCFEYGTPTVALEPFKTN